MGKNTHPISRTRHSVGRCIRPHHPHENCIYPFYTKHLNNNSFRAHVKCALCVRLKSGWMRCKKPYLVVFYQYMSVAQMFERAANLLHILIELYAVEMGTIEVVYGMVWWLLVHFNKWCVLYGIYRAQRSFHFPLDFLRFRELFVWTSAPRVYQNRFIASFRRCTTGCSTQNKS